jgi:diguanylate cyclase (GGDEF)-like protein
MKHHARTAEELQKRLLISARSSLLAAPAGAALVFIFLHGRLSSTAQVVWACVAALTGLALAAVSHLLLNQRIRLSPTLVRCLLLINPLAAQSFLFVFHPHQMSREAMLEALIGAMICISQMVTFSADRLAARGVAVISLASMSLAATSLLHFPVLVRVLATLPVALTFLQTSETLHKQQRNNIRLKIENEDLISDLRSANARLGREVKHDSLTGLMNRSGLYDALAQPRPIGLLYVDVDRFKSVNDTLGHAAGDEVLKQVGLAIRKVTRPNDVVARIGGDEFVVLLDGSSPESTIEAGTRICSSVRALFASTPSGTRRDPKVPNISVTVSVGAASGVVGAESADEVIARADRALYSAKRLGGNCLEVAV